MSEEKKDLNMVKLANDLLCGRKLTFGDQEQIDALKEKDREAQEAEKELPWFRVTVTFDGTYEEDVQAHDEEEAIEEVMDGFSLDSVDDIDYHKTAREIKKEGTDEE